MRLSAGLLPLVAIVTRAWPSRLFTSGNSYPWLSVVNGWTTQNTSREDNSRPPTPITVKIILSCFQMHHQDPFNRSFDLPRVFKHKPDFAWSKRHPLKGPGLLSSSNKTLRPTSLSNLTDLPLFFVRSGDRNTLFSSFAQLTQWLKNQLI